MPLHVIVYYLLQDHFDVFFDCFNFSNHLRPVCYEIMMDDFELLANFPYEIAIEIGCIVSYD